MYTFEEIVSIETERGKMLKTSTLIELREVKFGVKFGTDLGSDLESDLGIRFRIKLMARFRVKFRVRTYG